MKTLLQGPDVIDTRMVFRAYAILAGLAALLLFLPPPGVTTTFVSDPAARVTLLRLAGAFVLAAACTAVGFSLVEEPHSRHRALLWFAVGHLAVTVTLFATITAHGGRDGRDIGWPALLAVTVLLFYFWSTGDGHRAGESLSFTGLFSAGRPSAARLRSAYEERIREAAGQEERHRLARELHDSIKQQIFAMQTAAATAQARFHSDPEGAKEALERLRGSGREAMSEMEAMLDSLRATPLTNAGLVEALRKQGEALQFRTASRVEFEFGPLPPDEALIPGTQQVIFRVAQEALANVGRHARATRVRLALRSSKGKVLLAIEDDGAGFSTSAPAAGMGLANMRERAHSVDGTLAVDSRPGSGTTVTLNVPLSGWGQADLDDYRRRMIAWGGVTSILLVLVASHLRPGRTDPDLFIEVAMVIWTGVIFTRTVVAFRRARRRAEVTPWIEPVSHS
jgi:signal transduction histidine kinase